MEKDLALESQRVDIRPRSKPSGSKTPKVLFCQERFRREKLLQKKFVYVILQSQSLQAIFQKKKMFTN